MMRNRRACWNCDGNVHIHNTKCPYCGTDLTEEPVVSAVPHPPYGVPSEASQQEPAYVSSRVQEEGGAEEPEPMLRQVTARKTFESEPFEEEPVSLPVESGPVSPSYTAQPPSHSMIRGVILPMLMLLPGAFFLLFSTVLLLFSSDGVLTLQWNAHYWVLYLGLALPMLYFGWRSMNRGEEVGHGVESPE